MVRIIVTDEEFYKWTPQRKGSLKILLSIVYWENVFALGKGAIEIERGLMKLGPCCFQSVAKVNNNPFIADMDKSDIDCGKRLISLSR